MTIIWSCSFSDDGRFKLQRSPILGKEVNDVEGVSVSHTDCQVEHRLSGFLTETNTQTFSEDTTRLDGVRKSLCTLTLSGSSILKN